jgi:hypothetical protein
MLLPFFYFWYLFVEAYETLGSKRPQCQSTISTEAVGMKSDVSGCFSQTIQVVFIFVSWKLIRWFIPHVFFCAITDFFSGWKIVYVMHALSLFSQLNFLFGQVKLCRTECLDFFHCHAVEETLTTLRDRYEGTEREILALASYGWHRWKEMPLTPAVLLTTVKPYNR